MKIRKYSRIYSLSLLGGMFLASCASYPTLQEVAAMRQNNGKKNTDLTLEYKLADIDVVNYTDKVKESLARHFNGNSALRYGSATTQMTLATLAGAAKTAGWSVGTASGLGLAAGYVFSLGQVFNAKDKAQTYEQAFTAVQAAEATYYFHRLGMTFTTENGHTIVVSANPNGRNDVPSSTNYTPDGETLYYRVGKILKVLDDALASKIPDLQDLKDAQGDTSTAVKPPAKSGDAPSTGTTGTSHSSQSATSSSSTTKNATNSTDGGTTKGSASSNDKTSTASKADADKNTPLPVAADPTKLQPAVRVIGGGGGQPVTITPATGASQAPSTTPAPKTKPASNH